MLAKFEFNLSDPDDKRSFEIMNKADDILLSMCKFSNKLREEIKYGDPAKVGFKTYIEIQELLFEILNEYNIDLDELT